MFRSTPNHPRSNRSEEGKHRVTIAVGTTVATLCAAVVYTIFSGDSGKTEKQTVAPVKQEITQYLAELNTQIGSLATYQQVVNEVTAGYKLRVPGTGLGVDAETTSTYRGYFPTQLDFVIKGAGWVSTTRPEAEHNSSPLPKDEVIVEIDRSALIKNRPRIDASEQEEKFKVVDGYLVERNGRPVAPPQRIFAPNGEYTGGKYKVTGQDSGATDALELATGGHDFGGAAAETLHKVGQAWAGSPECIRTAFAAVSADELATTATTDYYVAQGFNPANVKVGFKEGSAWPTPEEMRDEDGRTFNEVRQEVEKSLPKDTKFTTSKTTTTTTCLPGNLADARNVPVFTETVKAPSGKKG